MKPKSKKDLNHSQVKTHSFETKPSTSVLDK